MRRRHVDRTLARVAKKLAALVERLVAERPEDDGIPDGFSPLETAIIEALSDGSALPGKKIARRSGYAYSARIRTVLAKLTRDGHLTHGPDGYKLRCPVEQGQGPTTQDAQRAAEQQSGHEHQRPDRPRRHPE